MHVLLFKIVALLYKLTTLKPVFMETISTNKELTQQNPAAANNKKTWTEPTLLVIDRGYVEGGAIVGLHEVTTTPTFGKKGTLS